MMDHTAIVSALDEAGAQGAVREWAHLTPAAGVSRWRVRTPSSPLGGFIFHDNEVVAFIAGLDARDRARPATPLIRVDPDLIGPAF